MKGLRLVNVSNVCFFPGSNVTKMRKKQILLLKIGVVVWVCVIYAFFLHKPSSTQKSHDITEQLDKLEEELNKQSQFYTVLLNKLRTMYQQQQNLGDDAVLQESCVPSYPQDPIIESPLLDGPVLPVLLIACNRDAAVRRSLDLLLKYRPSQERFPIVVSQDCGHRPTREAIESYGDKVTLIQHPDLSDIEVPLKERKFKGYFLIARHYRWALNQMFQKFEYEAVIIVEDDLDIAPDFYEYFSATYPILRADPSLWCVSAWNDNAHLRNSSALLLPASINVLPPVYLAPGPCLPHSSTHTM
ncbi:Alpha-1,3-mannosyl-glycoprotein 2-beta-N-acetylglucosaminyltransferase [Portunus trituberculatus]|uniref:Alpha-1,3-mannosyl-glycoprotein 2-beta-N-acetylglucosaminyltransferase n=1 Tax=Portunus trituberculatus TaxID=210409 RepID=A0A5B7DPE9_PORTR|nr:Alpha-1,3-mannosyl-glycoprotein 2-beta-N-acetylglucosaminyltransferase [Portunus trituberculatus]